MKLIFLMTLAVSSWGVWADEVQLSDAVSKASVIVLQKSVPFEWRRMPYTEPRFDFYVSFAGEYAFCGSAVSGVSEGQMRSVSTPDLRLEGDEGFGSLPRGRYSVENVKTLAPTTFYQCKASEPSTGPGGDDTETCIEWDQSKPRFTLARVDFDIRLSSTFTVGFSCVKVQPDVDDSSFQPMTEAEFRILTQNRMELE